MPARGFDGTGTDGVRELTDVTAGGSSLIEGSAG